MNNLVQFDFSSQTIYLHNWSLASLFAAIYESKIAVTANPEVTFRLRKGAHLPYIMPNPGFYSSLGGDMFDGYFFFK